MQLIENRKTKEQNILYIPKYEDEDTMSAMIYTYYSIDNKSTQVYMQFNDVTEIYLSELIFIDDKGKKSPIFNFESNFKDISTGNTVSIYGNYGGKYKLLPGNIRSIELKTDNNVYINFTKQ